MSHGYHSDSRFIWIDGTYTKKTWSEFCRSLHVLKALELPD